MVVHLYSLYTILYFEMVWGKEEAGYDVISLRRYGVKRESGYDVISLRWYGVKRSLVMTQCLLVMLLEHSLQLIQN